MATKTTEIIEQTLLQKRKENIEHCREKPKEYLDKIRLYNEKFGEMWTETELLEQVSENEVVASFFSKDPAKQNLTEQIVADIISSNPQVSNFKVLSKAGRNSLRLDEKGRIITGSSSLKNTKSIDYTFTYNGEQVYATQKFTRGKGGSQDNQCRDVVDFLNKGAMNEENQFMAILDGDYYEDGKLEEIQEMFEDNENITVSSADMFL